MADKDGHQVVLLACLRRRYALHVCGAAHEAEGPYTPSELCCAVKNRAAHGVRDVQTEREGRGLGGGGHFTEEENRAPLMKATLRTTCGARLLTPA